MAGSEELGKHTIEQLELSSRTVDEVVGLVEGAKVCKDVFEDKGVVANLSKLNKGVLQVVGFRIATL